MKLKDRVAVVTGGAKGIGRAICLAFATEGAAVVVNYATSQSEADATVRAIAANGGRSIAIKADIRDDAAARALMNAAVEKFGRLDILVNNAATNPVYGPVAETSSEAYDKIMTVNVKAPFEIGRRALSSMTSRGGGVVLNISSVAGLAPESGLGIYSVSKAALISLTQVLAREWGRYSVRVNALCPGFIKTDFSAALWKNESIMSMPTAQQPIPRWGEPGEVADFAVFLCTDQARFCTGASYLVDGGFMVRDQFAAAKSGGSGSDR